MRAIRLKARRGIGMEIFRVIYSKSIKRSSGHASGAGKVSTRFLRQLLECGSGLGAAIFSPLPLQDNLDTFRLWRPDPEMRSAFADQFRPNRVVPLAYCIRHPTPSTPARAVVVSFCRFRGSGTEAHKRRLNFALSCRGWIARSIVR